MEKICSQCNNPMKLRRGAYGEFWGCSTYPDCKNTVQIYNTPPNAQNGATEARSVIRRDNVQSTAKPPYSPKLDITSEILIKLQGLEQGQKLTIDLLNEIRDILTNELPKE